MPSITPEAKNGKPTESVGCVLTESAKRSIIEAIEEKEKQNCFYICPKLTQHDNVGFWEWFKFVKSIIESFPTNTEGFGDSSEEPKTLSKSDKVVERNNNLCDRYAWMNEDFQPIPNPPVTK